MTAAPVPSTDHCGSKMKDHREVGGCERCDSHCGLGLGPGEGHAQMKRLDKKNEFGNRGPGR